MEHPSDSSEQQAAEAQILAGLVSKCGPLAPKVVTLPAGGQVKVDGVAADESVFVEVFAHQGPMKGGQPKKVAADALKLITLRNARPGAKLVLAFADARAATNVISGSGWLAEALRTWDVAVEVISIDPTTRADLLAAQARQRMINPPTSLEQ